MDKYRVGDVVKLDDSCRESIRILKELDETAQFAYKTASEMMKNANENLFKAIFQAHPSLEGYQIRYDHKNHEVTVLYWKDRP